MIIKKLNTIFHKHSRVLFSVFTLVIIVSFLGFLTPGQFGCEGYGPGEGGTVGTAFGEKVSMGDLRELARKISIFNESMYGGSRELPPAQLFGTYCMLEKAGRLGITASDRELADIVRQFPTLTGKDGKFSLQKYRDMITKIGSYGISETDFTEALRVMATLDKLEKFISSSVVVTDGEVEELYRVLNTRFAVKSAKFKAGDFAAKLPPPKDAELRGFFERNRDSYRIDGKLSALIAEFPTAGFKAAASAAATPAALEKFFKANSFMFVDKNGKLPEFKTVAGKVRTAFINAEAGNMALRKAHEFAGKAYDAVGESKKSAERIKIFRDLAAENKVLIVEIGLVSFNAESIGKIKSPRLMRELSQLAAGNPIANAAPGEEGAYVGFLLSRTPERRAEFKEVSAKVTADFRRAESLKAAGKAAESAYAKLQKTTDAAAKSKAFATLKNCEFKNFAFSATEPPPSGLDGAMRVIDGLRPGEISLPIPTADGAMLIELIKRFPANMKDFKTKAGDYRMMLQAQKRNIAIGEMQRQLAEQCHYELQDGDTGR